MEMRLDCLTDRPSWLESVFCRVIGWKEPEEEVEVRDAGWSIVATDMSWCCLSRPGADFVRA